MFANLIQKIKEHKFLFSELVKRDFKKKYKRTYLGMLWSVLSPLLSLIVMYFVFGTIFGRGEHFITYLFCGTVVFSFFSDATNGGMGTLVANSSIFSKINVPKYLFLFSRIVTSLINFGLTLIILFILCVIDGVPFAWTFFAIPIPIICLIVFNIGMGLILSALFIFFRDIQYLWTVALTLISYLSAIFYYPDKMFAKEPLLEVVLHCNPIFVYIKYFRTLIINGQMPDLITNLLAVGYAVVAFVIGALIYKTKNHKFLYYI